MPFLMSNLKKVIESRYPEQEVLRNLQAAAFDYKKTHLNIMDSIKWRKEFIPLKITPKI